jgi:hypothetical protein
MRFQKDSINDDVAVRCITVCTYEYASIFVSIAIIKKSFKDTIIIFWYCRHDSSSSSSSLAGGGCCCMLLLSEDGEDS